MINISEYLEYLNNYKIEIINLAKNDNQKKYILDSFARWFMNSKKNQLNIFPEKNIICEEKDDFKYANKNFGCKFNIKKLLYKSQKIHIKYSNIFNKYEARNNPNIINLDKYNNLLSLLSKKQQKSIRIKYLCAGSNKQDFNVNMYIMLSLYKFIGIGNIHLSIPPIFKGVELFGSPLNVHNINYCSVFSIDKKFGSLGGFFEYEFHRDGIYLCNPPFDNKIINKMSDHLINQLNNTIYKVIIVVTIPVWDSLTQKEIGVKDYHMKFKGYEKLIGSDFIKEKDILNKHEYKYYDYFTDKFISVCHTHLIILSNIDTSTGDNMLSFRNKFNIECFKNNWKNYKITN